MSYDHDQQRDFAEEAYNRHLLHGGDDEPLVSTWGEIDSSWIGRHVRVRWEDAGMPLAEGLPSGMPHERRGVIERDRNYQDSFVLHEPDIHGLTSGIPAHALVQEED